MSRILMSDYFLEYGIPYLDLTSLKQLLYIQNQYNDELERIVNKRLKEIDDEIDKKTLCRIAAKFNDTETLKYVAAKQKRFRYFCAEMAALYCNNTLFHELYIKGDNNISFIFDEAIRGGNIELVKYMASYRLMLPSENSPITIAESIKSRICYNNFIPLLGYQNLIPQIKNEHGQIFEFLLNIHQEHILYLLEYAACYGLTYLIKKHYHEIKNVQTWENIKFNSILYGHKELAEYCINNWENYLWAAIFGNHQYLANKCYNALIRYATIDKNNNRSIMNKYSEIQNALNSAAHIGDKVWFDKMCEFGTITTATIYHAVNSADIDIIETCIKNVPSFWNYRYLLIYATWIKNKKILQIFDKYLFNTEIFDIDNEEATNELGNNLLYYAILCENIVVIKYFLDKGIIPTNDCLFYIPICENIELLQLIISRNNNIDMVEFKKHVEKYNVPEIMKLI